MSMRPMYKTCPHCKQRFKYDPARDILGTVCPYCGKQIGITDIIKQVSKIIKKRS